MKCRRYTKLKAIGHGKITPNQRRFVDSIDGLNKKILQNKGLVTESDRNRDLLKVLDRWQTYNPSYRMEERFIAKPNNLKNDRPDAYIWYQGKLYADKTKNAVSVNNAFGHPGYEPN